VFGARAGRNAARRALQGASPWRPEAARPALDLLRSATQRDAPNPAAIIVQLKALMADMAGPFRTEPKLRSALQAIERLKTEIGEIPLSSAAAFDPVLVDWLDLRNMLLVAQSVIVPAQARTESRGAHQREDHPGLDNNWCVNQIVTLSRGEIHLGRSAPSTGRAAA
jgi:succinate dehydrogenase / fumarate reductase flavoprotein subunit